MRLNNRRLHNLELTLIGYLNDGGYTTDRQLGYTVAGKESRILLFFSLKMQFVVNCYWTEAGLFFRIVCFNLFYVTNS